MKIPSGLSGNEFYLHLQDTKPYQVDENMKVMIRRSAAGALSAYVAKKDLETPIVSIEKAGLWGGMITLANGWQLELPQMAAETRLPITVEARKIDG